MPPLNSPAQQEDLLANAHKVAQKVEALLSLLANRHRLIILCSLIEGVQNVGELLQKVDLSQSALSQHLSKLREAELVITRRSGQSVYYSIHSKEAIRLIETLCELYIEDDVG